MATVDPNEELILSNINAITATAQGAGNRLEAERNRNAATAQRKSETFSIDSFRTEIASRGVLPTHSFILLLDGSFFTNESTSAYEYQNKMISMRCESVSIPGVNFMMQDITRFGYGPITRMPHAAQFNMLTMNFLVDENAAIYKFFNDWSNRIINHTSKGGSEMRINRNGVLPYQVQYKKFYAIPQMSLLVSDRKSQQVIEILFYDAFPTVINDINLSWGEQDTPMRLSVTMSFTDAEYKFQYLDDNRPLATSNYDPLNDTSPAQEGKKRSVLGRLFNNVGKAAGKSVVDGLIEETERKAFRIVDSII